MCDLVHAKKRVLLYGEDIFCLYHHDLQKSGVLLNLRVLLCKVLHFVVYLYVTHEKNKFSNMKSLQLLRGFFCLTNFSNIIILIKWVSH